MKEFKKQTTAILSVASAIAKGKTLTKARQEKLAAGKEQTILEGNQAGVIALQVMLDGTPEEFKNWRATLKDSYPKAYKAVTPYFSIAKRVHEFLSVNVARVPDDMEPFQVGADTLHPGDRLNRDTLVALAQGTPGDLTLDTLKRKVVVPLAERKALAAEQSSETVLAAMAAWLKTPAGEPFATDGYDAREMADALQVGLIQGYDYNTVLAEGNAILAKAKEEEVQKQKHLARLADIETALAVIEANMPDCINRLEAMITQYHAQSVAEEPAETNTQAQSNAA